VKEVLGHKNIATTSNTYGHLFKDETDRWTRLAKVEREFLATAGVKPTEPPPPAERKVVLLKRPK
jgi:hypothetical protein